MSLFVEVMRQLGFVESRKDGRCPAYGLEVRYGSGQEEKALQIRDISATGMFMLTQERLQPGTHSNVILRHKETSRGHSCPRVKLRVKSVRQDENGVGLSFEPHSPIAGSWLELMAMAAPVAAPVGAVARFRTAKALSFLAGIAAPVHTEIAERMKNSMGYERRMRLVDMVLAAEEQLEQGTRPVRSRISADLIRQILLMGSDAEDKRAHSFWRQLLISSCLTIHKEDESLQLADALSKLLPIDLELFCAGFEIAMAGGWNDSGKIYCSAKDLRKIAHTPNLIMVEQHLHHLYDVGLFERTVKPLKGEQIGEGNLTVTPLGVELYARCCEFPSART